MIKGDIVQFLDWPTPGGSLDWTGAKVGVVLDITMTRPDDPIFRDELAIFSQGTVWSIPSTWCRKLEDIK